MQQYNQQIEPIATQATVPEEIHPVAAAFGGDIGKAMEQGGSAIEERFNTLTYHYARMQYYQHESQRADLINKYKTSFQDKLYGDPSDPNATVTAVNGKIIPKDLTFQASQEVSNLAPQQTTEIPAAIYSRKGYAANGSLEDLDNWHHKASDEIIEQAKGLGLRNSAILRSEMDNAWASERNLVARHESTETDKAQQQTFFKGMQLDADNAVTKQDPISLGRTIASIQNTNKILNDSQGKPVDDPIRQVTEDKFVSMAINNSTTAMLRTNSDPSQAQATIDKLHDDGKINDTVYQNATQHIDKSFKVMTEQATRSAKIQQTNGRMNLIDKVSQGKVDLSNQSAIDEIAQSDPKLAEAINENILNKGGNVKDNDATFADLVNKIYTSGSKEQISNFTMQALKANTGKELSQDRLNILVNSAMERGKNIADLNGDAEKKNPIQSAIDSGMKALFGWNKDQGKHDGQTYADYMTSIKAGKSVSESYNTSIANSAIRQNPTITTIPKDGKLMIDRFGNRATVYPDGTFKELTAEPKKEETK